MLHIGEVLIEDHPEHDEDRRGGNRIGIVEKNGRIRKYATN
jgi:hypothetical protein